MQRLKFNEDSGICYYIVFIEKIYRLLQINVPNPKVWHDLYLFPTRGTQRLKD